MRARKRREWPRTNTRCRPHLSNQGKNSLRRYSLILVSCKAVLPHYQPERGKLGSLGMLDLEIAIGVMRTDAAASHCADFALCCFQSSLRSPAGKFHAALPSRSDIVALALTLLWTPRYVTCSGRSQIISIIQRQHMGRRRLHGSVETPVLQEILVVLMQSRLLRTITLEY